MNDPDVIASVDGHADDGAKYPLVGQRLGPPRIDFVELVLAFVICTNVTARPRPLDRAIAKSIERCEDALPRPRTRSANSAATVAFGFPPLQGLVIFG